MTPAEFRERLLIDVDGRLVRLVGVLDDRQRQDFAALDPGWQRCVGMPADGGFSRAKLIRPRGGSKSTDLATMAAWALTMAPRRVEGVVAAADFDQAGLIKKAFLRLIADNKFLASFLDVQRDRIVNVVPKSKCPASGSELVIITSDAGSSWGHLVDWVLADEQSVWKGETGESLWNSLFSAVGKKKNALCIIAENAGWKRTWQHRLHERLEVDPLWYSSTWCSPAKWIPESTMAEQRRTLLPFVYDRVWCSEWVDADGGGAFDPASVAAAVRLKAPILRAEPGYAHVLALDLGVTQDATGMIVLRKQAGRYQLCHARKWLPKKGQQVDLAEVEEAVIEAYRRYRCVCAAYDPAMAHYLIQRLRQRGLYLKEISQGPANQVLMASMAIEVMAAGLLDIYPCDDLINDLHRTRTEEKGYGVRLVTKRGRDGHGDLAQALWIGLVASKGLAGYSGGSSGQYPISVAGRIGERSYTGGSPMTCGGIGSGSVDPKTLAAVNAIGGTDALHRNHIVRPPMISYGGSGLQLPRRG